MPEKLQTISVKEFMLAQGYVSVVKVVRENTNKYPYITFIDANNSSENIYFSKNASKLVGAGEVISKGFFNQFQAAQTTNADGELRWKLTSRGEGMRLDIDELF